LGLSTFGTYEQPCQIGKSRTSNLNTRHNFNSLGALLSTKMTSYPVPVEDIVAREFPQLEGEMTDDLLVFFSFKLHVS
jgi:hypothetical protein